MHNSLPPRAVWIGASDKKSEGNHVWPTGDDLKCYKNWDNGQPNGGDCVLMMTQTGKWHDYGCWNYYHYVCE